METKIKICGLKRSEDILAANEIKPDYVGFVFALKKREVTEEEAAELKKLLDPSIPAVGVFVNDDPERIIRLLKNGTIDIAQLHGKETPEEALYIKEETGKPVTKAIILKSEEDWEKAKVWMRSPVDFLLFDAGQGDGKTFDWNLLKEVEKPFFLAGGLTPENIADAIRTVHPYCVDISSGVETEPGSYTKDPEKMKQAVMAVRNIG